MSERKIKHSREEIKRRVKGIVASASFEDLNLTHKEIKMLEKLGNGEISRNEYDEYFGLK